MSDNTTKLQDERINHALSLQEDEKLDFKRVGKVDKMVKAASAMANTDGGYIVAGIDDPRKAQGRDRVYGVEENPEAIGEFTRAIVSGVIPPLAPPHLPENISIRTIPCTLRDGNPGRVCLIHIPRSNEVHSLRDGPTYIRVPGPQDRQLLAHEVVELSLRRGTKSVVDAPVAVDTALLNTPTWVEYYTQRQLSRPMDTILPHLGLAVRDEESDRWLPKMAAILLFAEHPGSLLNSKAAIRIFHYRGHAIEHDVNTNLVRPPITVDGPLLHQIRKATQAVLEEINRDGGVQVTTAGFSVRRAYPVRVIQEAVTNAVLHRDYRIPQDIHIRIFANRIEVESPGGFPGAVSPENIGKIGSRPRNITLVNHLREFPVPPNLDAGEGVPMMLQTMKREGLFPPSYNLLRHPDREAVCVSLRNEARNDDWEMVEDYLHNHPDIGNAELRAILNIPATNLSRASKLLTGWVEARLLVIINPDAGTKLRRYGLASRKNTPETLDRLLSDPTGKDFSDNATV